MAAVAAVPELNYIYPAGGRPDSEFEVEVGGALEDIALGVFSSEGVKATLLGPAKEVTYTKKGKAVLKPVSNRYRFSVTVAKDAKPGIRQFRVCTAYKVSEPLRFEVSAMPEASEALTNRAVASETTLSALPVCLNGRVFGAGADRYRFHGTKGMTVVAFTEARVLPRGLFRPVLSFTDAEGKPCEGVSVYDAATAPVAVFEVPRDGAYALNVASASGKGWNASVYRIKLGELPLITWFSPRGAKSGASLNVQLSGANLEQKRVRLFTGGKNSELCLETLVGDAFVLPGLRFDLSDEPDAEETEPNDTAETAQPLELPCVVNGDLAAQGGRDFYRFSGKKGDAFAVDVRAAALGSPLKARVTVRDGRGAAVAGGSFDANATVRAAVCGRDPSVVCTLPEDGAYGVEVSDVGGRSGPEFVYRLRVGPPQPDFELWMTPASLNIPADGSELVTLHLNRLHGFDGEVRVTLDYPPLSIACEGGLIPAGETFGKMTVSTDGVRYPRTVFGLSLTGVAQIGERVVRHPAVPIVFRPEPDGTYERCAFDELSAKVGPGVRALRIDQLVKGPVDVRTPMPTAFRQPVPVGFKEPLRLTVLSATLATHLGGLYVPTVVWPPRGFTVAGVQPTNKQERAGVLLKADASVMKPGQTGYFILGCYEKGSTNRTVTAYTQSVPFVIR
jgi:hypothetical protein